jgi:micrococcal nuclease
MYTYQAKVYNVVDGDTVDVLVDLGFKIYSKQRIRLARIDTPERGQEGYDKAKDRLKELVLDKDVALTTTKPSKWGYYLGELFILNENVNNTMLSEGLARPTAWR